MTPSPLTPHYILYSSSDPVKKTWRFSICSTKGATLLEVSDREPDAPADRLALLAVVLGLEALEQPSHIILCTPSRYVQEGIQFGVPEWRANGWQWEYFGQMVPVKHRDLWQRVERAMRFHRVECRSWRFDPPHKALFAKRALPPQKPVGTSAVCFSRGQPAESKRLCPPGPGHCAVSHLQRTIPFPHEQLPEDLPRGQKVNEQAVWGRVEESQPNSKSFSSVKLGAGLALNGSEHSYPSFRPVAAFKKTAPLSPSQFENSENNLLLTGAVNPVVHSQQRLGGLEEGPPRERGFPLGRGVGRLFHRAIRKFWAILGKLFPTEPSDPSGGGL
ncbi:MAG: hypothetical protein NZ602_08675 [Thermoguttaceae bacterium]|nr:hypothetical protein [Thermoguttaceae bacterium]MDW8036475.1 RNase H family protein [Thermoguttaceae bacterium]